MPDEGATTGTAHDARLHARASEPAANPALLPWDEQRQRDAERGHAQLRCRLEACCLDSVVGDVRRERKVPTGGELTLFEAVGRWA